RFDGIQIDTNLSSDLPLAEIDMGLIQQVLINLLHNASDALSETTGERRIEINSHVITEGPEARVRIEVIDNGPGVLPDREDILFKERFTTKRRGHGYGLVTCRKIMETHQGRVDYVRRENTVFLIEFPTVHQLTETETDSADRQSMTTPTI
ncbi:MAG: GHKL domain-containing protein, partial [candidate division Zixibacteria bacterium]|nr:GHKL domain-containing protein [candidate division Zixibacteria bacterium]